MSCSPSTSRATTATDLARFAASQPPTAHSFKSLQDGAFKERDPERERTDSVAGRPGLYRGNGSDATSVRPPYQSDDGANMPRMHSGLNRETERSSMASPLGSRRTAGEDHKDAFSSTKFSFGEDRDSRFAARPPFRDDKDQRQPSKHSLPSLREALADDSQPHSSDYFPQGYKPVGTPQTQQVQSSPVQGHRQQLPGGAPSMNAGGYLPQPHEASPHATRYVQPPVLPPGSSSDGYSSSYSSEYRRSSGTTSSLPTSTSDGYSPAFPDHRPPTTQPMTSALPPLRVQPPLHVQTGPPSHETPRTQSSYYSYSQQSSPRFEPPPTTIQPPNAYSGYPQYGQHQYPNSAPPTGTPGAPFNQQSMGPPPAGHPATAYPIGWNPRLDGADVNRVEESKRTGRPTNSTYGQSVKRKLESFDYETSLNEVSKDVRDIASFSSQFSRLAHQAQKSGLGPADLPELVHVDDMINRSQQIYDALVRIRDFVETENSSLNYPNHDSHYGIQNGYGGHDQRAESVFGDDRSISDKNGGFAMPDSKKRRGRAAPPGRCHSCNRAETPEWRRGPDGARTLCNACGLHYAKLTRKVGAAKAGTIEYRKGYGPTDVRSPTEVLEKMREQSLQPKEGSENGSGAATMTA